MHMSRYVPLMQLRKRRVLVVDDDADTRLLLSRFLAEEGFDVQTAVDGGHGVRSAVALTPDLIILDMYVPAAEFAIGLSLEYRQKVPPGAVAPIIAVSAQPDLEELAQRIGAVAFLAKPFDVEELLGLVRRHIRDPATGA